MNDNNEKIEIEEKESKFDGVVPRTEIVEFSKEEKEKIKEEVTKRNEGNGHIDKEGLQKSLNNFSVVVIGFVLIALVAGAFLSYYFLPKLLDALE